MAEFYVPLPVPEPDRPQRRLPRGTILGIWALVVALLVLLAITFLPTSYVIQQPGPVYNTLGTVTATDGSKVPLISVEGAETFETAGALDLTTVQLVGDRERTPVWFDLVRAWFDPSRAIVPIDVVFPGDQTSEERGQESAALMVDSQHEATAAALTELGYDVGAQIAVVELTDDSASAGVLEPGDVIVSADGTPVDGAEELRAIIQEDDGAPVELVIARDDTEQTVTVTPKQAEVDGETTWLIGVILTIEYDFPIDVSIQLNNVGGPSAGQMFALGIIDVLTPGELNGGRQIAGTGTISADGTIGPIGGIRQKLHGARDAGATYFLAPETNCDEVIGHVPAGLQVFSVETLDDSLAVLDAIAADGDLAALPTCTLR